MIHVPATIRQTLHSVAQVTKARIAFLGALSAGMGALLANGRAVAAAGSAALGVFLLAAAACALNQWQERHLDSLMTRTANRPLPAKRLTPSQVLILVQLLASGGAGVLFVGCGWRPTLLALAAALWYNGVYTPLKRRTALAALPGALIGAVTPAVGWTAAGGSFQSPVLWAVATFFFLWQVPHFWLLLIHHGPDYQRAGLPTLTTHLSRAQLARATFVWLAATAVSCLFIPLFAQIRSYLLLCFLVGAGGWLLTALGGLLRLDRRPLPLDFGFRQLNAYALTVTCALMLAGHLR